jgi:hypothetical protein
VKTRSAQCSHMSKLTHNVERSHTFAFEKLALVFLLCCALE